MAKSPLDTDVLRSFLEKEKIAALSDLKAALKTMGTMTVFRRLKALGYLSSYSHRGKFYTLKDIPDFDELGLWSYHSVWFSKYGNLVETARELVAEAGVGFTASELENILHVECKRPLLQLYNEKRVHREKHSGVYVYFSTEKGHQRSQVLLRREHAANLEIGVAPEIEVLTHEVKAAIILFFSLLDEKQRRLYAGLEAQKLGHGGDRKIAGLLGLDVGTVAKGRRELFGGDIDSERIRKEGGGRKSVEKKRLKS